MQRACRMRAGRAQAFHGGPPAGEQSLSGRGEIDTLKFRAHADRMNGPTQPPRYGGYPDAAGSQPAQLSNIFLGPMSGCTNHIALPQAA